MYICIWREVKGKCLPSPTAIFRISSSFLVHLRRSWVMLSVVSISTSMPTTKCGGNEVEINKR